MKSIKKTLHYASMVVVIAVGMVASPVASALEPAKIEAALQIISLPSSLIR